MRTIYIDNNYMCHPTMEDGFRKIETENIGIICDEALIYYRFVPQGEEWDGVICANDFIQCIKSKAERIAWNEFFEKNPKPDAPEGYDYKLKEDLTWELYELPIIEEDENE